MYRTYEKHPPSNDGHLRKPLQGGAVHLISSEDQSFYIPLKAVHRLENPGTTPLRLIEVQTGANLSEDDIIRLDDDYRREL